MMPLNTTINSRRGSPKGNVQVHCTLSSIKSIAEEDPTFAIMITEFRTITLPSLQPNCTPEYHFMEI